MNKIANSTLIRANQNVANNGKKVVIGPNDAPAVAEVLVHQSDNEIQTIEVKCKCGETIILECEYQ